MICKTKPDPEVVAVAEEENAVLRKPDGEQKKNCKLRSRI